MPSFARREIVDRSEIGVYHCVNRCVRRAFLCGCDPLSGRNLDHRKTWIRDRLEELAGIFAIDILHFAVLSNHLHVVLRNRPDIAAAWSDDEVARRWWRLFPARRDDDGSPAEPEPHELLPLLSDPQQLTERRRRLADLSWLMRTLCEPIARAANAEDGCTGRFWEGRFKSQAVLDESALLACGMYVDLNPIRAGVAQTPETSEFTSVYERITARQAALAGAAGLSDQAAESREAIAPDGSVERCEAMERSGAAALDGWLSPMADGDVRAGDTQAEDGNVRAASAAASHRRASDRGFLPLSFDDYLQLLDWTGRQLRQGKSGSIPSHLQPIFARLAINGPMWVESVRNFGRWFHRAVGRVESLTARAQRGGRRWFQGLTASRLAFG